MQDEHTMLEKKTLVSIQSSDSKQIESFGVMEQVCLFTYVCLYVCAGIGCLLFF